MIKCATPSKNGVNKNYLKNHYFFFTAFCLEVPCNKYNTIFLKRNYEIKLGPLNLAPEEPSLIINNERNYQLLPEFFTN